MVAISQDFKWFGFQISDSFGILTFCKPTLFWSFKIYSMPGIQIPTVTMFYRWVNLYLASSSTWPLSIPFLFNNNSSNNNSRINNSNRVNSNSCSSFSDINNSNNQLMVDQKTTCLLVLRTKLPTTQSMSTTATITTTTASATTIKAQTAMDLIQTCHPPIPRVLSWTMLVVSSLEKFGNSVSFAVSGPTSNGSSNTCQKYTAHFFADVAENIFPFTNRQQFFVNNLTIPNS